MWQNCDESRRVRRTRCYQANQVGQADADAPADISGARQIITIASYLASHAGAVGAEPDSNQTRPGCCPRITVTFFVVPDQGTVVARPGMTCALSRTHDPGGGVTGSGGIDRPLNRDTATSLVGLLVTWVPALDARTR